jgi:(E)-4-hydroxy-3-methylbut-2-enyl-diphosphate synthase
VCVQPAHRTGTPAADLLLSDGNLWVAAPRQVPGHRDNVASGVREVVAPAGMVGVIHLRDGITSPYVPTGNLVLIGVDDADPVGSLRRGLAVLPPGMAVGIAEPGALGELRAYRLLAAVIEDEFRAAEGRSIGTGIRQPICIALPFLRDDLAIAAVAGGLLIDGIGDALYLPGAADPRALAFTLLQAVKARTTRADYVACPSCGRTQFDLFEVTAHIREKTAHLDGVAIAIMGCIVNGPGEMADADFGFVGSGPGKVDLYRGREVVRRNIPFEQGRDQLIDLIRESGKWREPVA